MPTKADDIGMAENGIPGKGLGCVVSTISHVYFVHLIRMEGRIVKASQKVRGMRVLLAYIAEIRLSFKATRVVFLHV